MRDDERASPADSAKALKAALTAAFPAVRFSVRLSRGTAWGYCSVSWTDGPTPPRVDAVCAPFEGETLSSEPDDSTRPTRNRLPDGRLSGLRSVNTSRTISARFAQRVANAVAAWWGGEDMRAPLIVPHGASYCYDLESDRRARARTGEEWYTLIHRAAWNRLTITPTQEN